MADPTPPTHSTPEFDDYLAALSAERVEVLVHVIDLVEKALPAGYVRMIDFGMPHWVIPLDDYGDTYNGHPLSIAALAAQKNYTSLYLHSVYASAEETAAFQNDWAASGKKLTMGKSCVRFKKFDDLALDAITGTIARTTPDVLIALHEQAHTT